MNYSTKLVLGLAWSLGLQAVAGTVEIHMASDGGKMHFVPAVVTVKKGDTVKWINDDARKQFHTVTSGKVVGATGKPDKLFDSKMLGPGKTFERVFADAGEFEYYCVPHVPMKMFGKVIVK